VPQQVLRGTEANNPSDIDIAYSDPNLGRQGGSYNYSPSSGESYDDDEE
jgi:hypothetical protein